MAFWGVEVKPGKSFTHKFDDLKGRLHLSMATLGFGATTAKSILQCNVGNRSPVYLCSLSPGMNESLQLNLEFEEVDEVLFSVIGPRSVHLCGYYLGSGRSTNINEDSESYGEDIADTETERSDCSDEDEYENSFIDDDGDPDVYRPSPISNEEEASHVKKPKGRKGSLRRLRRKYQRIESEDDQCFEEYIAINNNTNNQIKKIDNEDSLPISSLYKSKTIGRVLDQEMDVSDDRRAGDGSNKNGNSISKSNFKAIKVLVDSQTNRGAKSSDNLAEHCTVLDIGNIQKFKKKKKEKEKEKEKEVKYIEAKGACNGQSIKQDTVMEDEPKMDKTVQDLPSRNGQSQRQADDNRETETWDKELYSSEVGCEQGEELKRKRKERSKKGIKLVANDACHSNLINEEKEKSLQDEIKADSVLIDLPQRNELSEQPIIHEDVELPDNVSLPSIERDPEKGKTKRKKEEQVNEVSHFESDNAYHKDVVPECKAPRDKAESDNVICKFPEEKEQNQKLTNKERGDNVNQDFLDANQSKDRKIKKRKKKSKSQGNGEVENYDMLQLSVEQSSGMVKQDGNEMANAILSQGRTLSNGLVIQELEMGTADGKIAASGRKISVHYIGKLKKNGEVFESNVGHAPFKFRLGKGEFIEGWDVGLEGMRVGEKRRLIIPPSMGFGSEGHGENVPPNSWLVYDFELVKVH